MEQFFNPTTNQKLLERLERLNPVARPAWGIMNAAQMLKHLQLENDLALGRYTGKDHSNLFKEWGFKMVIKGRMPLPSLFSKMRMVPAIPELDVVKSKMRVEDFETERTKLTQSFHDLLAVKETAPLHPAIGKMSREEWSLFYYWHTDYHFKQFNI